MANTMIRDEFGSSPQLSTNNWLSPSFKHPVGQTQITQNNKIVPTNQQKQAPSVNPQHYQTRAVTPAPQPKANPNDYQTRAVTPAQSTNQKAQLSQVQSQMAQAQQAHSQAVNSGNKQQAQMLANQVSQLQAIERMLRENSDAFFSEQEAMLTMGRDQQLTELKKAYEDAVAQGEMSIREAETAFKQNSEAINQQAYQDAQGTQVMAQGRGIQNSQQMVGLMQGDNARSNDFRNQNMMARDQRVADLKDRINSITKQKDLDIANVNNQFNMGVRQAKGQADQMFNQAMVQIKHEDYISNRNHSFDLAKMDKAFQQDLQKMAQQFKHSSALQGQAHANSMSQARAQYSDKIAEEERTYQRDLARINASFKEGTPEHFAAVNQAKLQSQQNIQKLHDTTIYNAVIGNAVETINNTPSKPQPGFMGIGVSKKNQAIFNNQQDAYNRALNVLDNPWNAVQNPSQFLR